MQITYLARKCIGELEQSFTPCSAGTRKAYSESSWVFATSLLHVSTGDLETCPPCCARMLLCTSCRRRKAERVVYENEYMPLALYDAVPAREVPVARWRHLYQANVVQRIGRVRRGGAVWQSCGGASSCHACQATSRPPGYRRVEAMKV